MDVLIIYIMGVSGSGKTTIGKQLSLATGIPFFDGDDFHPTANKKKMSAGIPLNDEDREGWLNALHDLAKEKTRQKGAIIACSALKQKYRTQLAEDMPVPVRWVFLQGSYELIRERMKTRKGHFMPDKLLKSQFDTLEAPSNVITIDISKDPETIVKEILTKLGAGLHHQS